MKKKKEKQVREMLSSWEFFCELWIGSTDLNINSYIIVKIPHGALMFGEPCILTADNVKSNWGP